MRLRIVAVLVGLLLLVVSQLGIPGAAATEPQLASLSEQAVNLCQSDESNLQDAEIAAACFTVDTCLDPPPVKQSEEEDGSGAVFAGELPPAIYRAPDTLAGLPQEVLPPPAPPVIPRYQVENNNNDVRRFLDQFQTGYRRAVVERWLVRAGRYLPMVLDVFKQKGLPEDLVFTAMIESGFDPLAASSAGARGLWQFMAPTARRYGLRVDRWLDERLDPEKSTVAAARHLLDLYAVFGSWNLAQAAYNAGERTVLEAIRAMGTSDFWALARGRWLKDETKNYIPAIQAATLIAHEPERYGFVVTPAPPLAYELVAVPRSTRLKELAGQSGISLDALERLNPELRLKQTPPDGPYSLKVPVGDAASVRAALAHETAHHVVAATRGELRRPDPPAGHATRPGIHVVKRQETVAQIARRYGVSVADILRWNDLTGAARIHPGDRLRVVSFESRVEAPASFK